MSEPEFLLFASDATLTGIAGGTLLLVAGLAWIGERRRTRRRHIDAVGCMPWTMVFFLAFFAGVILLSLAVKGWIAG